jgi:ribonuclease HI
MRRGPWPPVCRTVVTFRKRLAMSVPAPHFLLRARTDPQDERGRWYFTLESSDGAHSVEVEDAEPETRGDRLELLALVRGLEALPQPARVTLVESSRYVHRVLDGGLEEWRANDWRWERHGEMVPVKNADLWRRIDRALHFHELKCQPHAAGRHNDRSHRQAKSARLGCINNPSHRNRAPRRSDGLCGTVRQASGAVLTSAAGKRRNSLAHKVQVIAANVRRRLKCDYRRWHKAIRGFVAECDSYDSDF